MHVQAVLTISSARPSRYLRQLLEFGAVVGLVVVVGTVVVVVVLALVVLGSVLGGAVVANVTLAARSAGSAALIQWCS